MNYGEIVSRALAISWRHKYLWLMALLAGEGIGFSLPSFQQGRRSNNGRPFSNVSYDQITSWIGAHVTLLVTIGVGVLIVAIVLFLISVIANGAVVRGAAEHDADRPFGLRAAWRSGLGTFWPVLGVKLISLVVWLVVLAAIASLALVAFMAGSRSNVPLAVATGLTAGFLLLLSFPFGVVFGVAIRLAMRAVVLDGSPSLAAIRRGFHLIRWRFGRLALVWLLAVVCGLLGGVIVAAAAVIVALPLAAITAGSYVAGGIGVAIGVGVVLAIVWAVVALTLSAAVDAFVSTIWTLAYARLDIDPQPVPAGMPAPA
jgi:hypothetical protein